MNAHQDCPREAWIEIAVPALVESETFALAQELLEKNKRYASRRTIEPTLLQGILVCQQCGYALYRTSTRTSKRKLYYYRCLGSDNYRYPQGRICDHRPIRQDYLDERVWRAVLELLEDPDLIRAEIRRRMVQLQDSNPRKRKVELLGRELTRVQKGIAKLLDAYQEGLLDLDELRRRIPELRKREQALSSELTQLGTAAVDEQTFLRVADQLDDFLARLRHRAEALNITERQKILRLVVKEIFVDREKITIRHSIPVMRGGIYGEPVTHKHTPSYLLRSGRHRQHSLQTACRHRAQRGRAGGSPFPLFTV